LGRQLGIDDRIRWIDEMPHEQALAEMAAAHAFVFPSLQEASSTVVLEALSLGLPVVCHDACGFGMVVTDECGIRIPRLTPAQSVDGFATAIRQLIQSPELIAKLSAGALARSEELSWDHKAQAIAKVYDEVATNAAV
jgi:glycosyltransferase involved in cell wall biosynthesis